VAKKKLQRFAEIQEFKHVLQPTINEVFRKDYHLKGKWASEHFGNTNPLVLELGCGKGEYTTQLAQMFTETNFIGIDVKGARIWRGSKDVIEKNITNAAFLRLRIELIESVFCNEEVSEIWITFPDPQPKKAKRRLCSSKFLNYYSKFLKTNGIIHLKTDNKELHDYALDVIKLNELEIIFATDNLYSSNCTDKILNIKTFYEKKFLEQNIPITYIKFKMNGKQNLFEPK